MRSWKISPPIRNLKIITIFVLSLLCFVSWIVCTWISKLSLKQFVNCSSPNSTNIFTLGQTFIASLGHLLIFTMIVALKPLSVLHLPKSPKQKKMKTRRKGKKSIPKSETIVLHASQMSSGKITNLSHNIWQLSFQVDLWAKNSRLFYNQWMNHFWLLLWTIQKNQRKSRHIGRKSRKISMKHHYWISCCSKKIAKLGYLFAKLLQLFWMVIMINLYSLPMVKFFANFFVIKFSHRGKPSKYKSDLSNFQKPCISGHPFLVYWRWRNDLQSSSQSQKIFKNLS